MKIKQAFQNFLSMGLTPEMDEGEKIATRGGVLTTLGSFASYFTNGIYAYLFDLKILVEIDIIACAGLTLSLYFFHIRKNLLAKAVMYTFTMVMVAIAGDMVRTHYEMYFLTVMILPFMFFSPKDYKKSLFAASCVGIFTLIQIKIGKEHIRPFIDIPEINMAMMLFTIFIYLSFIMALGNSYTRKIQDDAEKKQKEIIHSSNIYSIGEMVGGVAFEINSPMQILTSNMASIRNQISSPDFDRAKVEEQIQTMDQTIDKIAALVNGIRKLTRNSVNDPVTEFNLNEMIESVLTVCERRLSSHGVHLFIQVEKDFKVKSQEGQLSQVLLNLLNNSIEAIDAVEEKWIRIESEVMDGRVQIKVTDSGQPLESDIVKRMMNPFFTTKEDGQAIGIGLNISQRIMEKLSGRLIYNSESSNTQFIMEFPRF